jgi:hypothetical protein
MNSMDRPNQSLADYVAIAISPALIMALVGSLVFFLLEILYVGKYAATLQHILFFFVFGAVLIARISMQGEIADRAPLYGLVLGALTWVALIRYVDYPEDNPLAPWAWAVNLGLITIIWWCAHRLTWDCTLIDDEVDASGAGLLEVAGLEKKSASPEQAHPVGSSERKKKDGTGLAGWWQRYCRYREERKQQPQAPGVWVVYFSLAALPLFGLGQTQIPPAESSRRQYAFQLLCIYVGSGLGLLLTTSFLGLRRYLRQRDLRMPAAITSLWLTLGAMLIVLVMGLGIVLPRPGAPHPLLQWTGLFGSPERDPSSLALRGEGSEHKKGRRAAKQESDDKDGKDPGQKTKAGGAQQDGNPDGDRSKDDRSAEGKDNGRSTRKEKDNASGGDNDKKTGPKKSSKDQRAGQAPPPQPQGGSSGTSDFWRKLSELLKWIVIGVMVLLVAFMLLRAGLRFLANFTNWAKGLLAAFQTFWQSLQGLWRKAPAAEASTLVQSAPPEPFAFYANPFLTGREQRMKPGELVRYTFDAFQAWAAEHGLGRQPEETPLEFARRVGEETPALEKNARALAQLYASLAYANSSLPATCRSSVRAFWEMLADVVDRPLSAGTGAIE